MGPSSLNWRHSALPKLETSPRKSNYPAAFLGIGTTKQLVVDLNKSPSSIPRLRTVTEPMFTAIAKQQGLEMPNRENLPVPGPLTGLGLTGLMKASESSPTGSSTEEVLQELADVRKEPVRKPFFETQLVYAIMTSLEKNSKGIKSLEESMKGFQKSMDTQTEMLRQVS